MKKTVWIVNHYASLPSVSATGSRHFSLGKALVSRGWQVCVFAATAEHNSDRQRSGDEGNNRETLSDGVRFRWIPTRSSVGNGLGRIAGILQFSIGLLRRNATAGLTRPDIVIGSTVHPFAAWSASKLARRHKAQFVFEVRDLWPETLIDMGALRRTSVMARALARLEAHLCTVADAIITTQPLAAEYFLARGVPERKLHWISNGTAIDAFAGDPPVPHAGPARLMYLGSVGAANGVGAIVRAFSLVVANPDRRESCVLEIVGSGAETPMIGDLIAKLGLTGQVFITPPVPKDDVPEIAAGADCLVINVLDLPIYRFGLSMNKLFDYMAAARPILIATDATENPVALAGGGVTVAADDPRAIAEGMEQFLDASAEERERWGRAGREYAQTHFDYEVLGEDLDQLLSGLCDERVAR